MRTALVAGSTGLIGKQLVNLLVVDPLYDSVIALSRKPLDIRHPKLKNLIVDFDQLATYAEELGANDVFCCLGTTMKRAGSKEAFWKVDHDYALNLAKITRQRGAQKFHLISALGANRNSSFYYNEVKGKLEEAIGEAGFRAYHIFRPSLLLGPRQEQRPAEEAAKKVYRMFNFLIPEKYKAIESEKVARAMVHFAKADAHGTFIHTSSDLQSF
jgi:uncharacterized protein YbjT (DUF2867 family)